MEPIMRMMFGTGGRFSVKFGIFSRANLVLLRASHLLRDA